MQCNKVLRKFDRLLCRSHPQGRKTCRPQTLLSIADELIVSSSRVGIAAVHESPNGTIETCRLTLRMSVNRGSPEVAGPRSERRE
jgi:hypothetical protein